MPVPKRTTVLILLTGLLVLQPLPGGPEDAWASTHQTSFVGTGEVARPFTAIAFESDDPRIDHVEFRTRSFRGPWSEWEEAHLSDDHGPDGAQVRPGSGVLWTGAQSAVQVRAGGTGRIDTVLIDTTERTKPFIRKVVDVLTVDPPTQAQATPDIQPRSAWNPGETCRPDNPDPVAYGTVDIAIVHHTAGRNDYSRSDVPDIILAHCAYHVDVRGWNDIAYNMVIDRFGQAWEARAGGLEEPVIGGHSRGFNSFSFGVALMGDFRSASAPSVMIDSLTEVLTWKLGIHRVDPDGRATVVSGGSALYVEGETVTLDTISGHRDVQATSCPGDEVDSLLPGIRKEVSERIIYPPYPITERPSSSAGTGLGIDGDGTFDLAYRGRCGPLGDPCWRVHDSTGASFTVRGAESWVNEPARLDPVSGDFDGDGNSDIAYRDVCESGSGECWSIAYSDGSVIGDAYSLGNGAWFSGETTTVGLVAGDFDGNGKDDLAYRGKCGSGSDCWRVHRSTGTGFRIAGTTGTIPTTSTFEAVAGDVNGDGKDDIITRGRCTTGSGTCWNIHLATRWGRIAPATSWGNGAWFSGETTTVGLVAGDFDGNGKDDLAYRGKCGSGSDCWRVHRSTGTGFRIAGTTGTIPTTSTFEAVAGDVNGDGKDDIITRGRCTTGSGTCWNIHLATRWGRIAPATSWGNGAWFSDETSEFGLHGG